MNNIQSSRIKTVIPVSDIYETDDNFFITMEIPGTEKENLDITVEDKKLTVTGTVRNEEEFQYSEFEISGFKRTFQVGNGINKDNIEAKLENGILEIKLYKSEETKPRKITVNEMH